MTTSPEPAAALQLGPRDLPELLRKRVIDDPKTIKVLSDPLRIRILRVLGEGAHTRPRVWTVKQLAEAIGVPPGKLYWHMKQLLAVDMIQVAEVAVVGGIIEQRYRVAQVGFRVEVDGLDDETTGTADTMALAEIASEDFLGRLRSAVMSGRAFISEEQSLAHSPHVRTVGTSMDVRIPREKAAEFADRLAALVGEFETHEHDGTGVQANLLAFFYATD